MESGPTRGASESVNAWRASPKLAFVVRAAAYAVPVAVAYLVIRMVGSWLFRPNGWIGLLVWVVQAAVIGALVSRGVGRLTRRLLPLATLLTTTLVFPDRAPSRFGVALRSGTVKQMRKRAKELHRDGLGSSPAEAAENAIVLVTGLGRHDRLTRGHTERVRAYADLVAEEMHLSDADRNWLAWGVLLHDVGKMTVPSQILNKAEKLTDEEWATLRNHPAAGEEMLQPLVPWLGDWVKAAGEHHERWDGRGYPRGLEGSEISLAGRIAAVADAYDVITSKRSYKEPMSAEAARRELVDCAGSQFDPAVVRAFLAVSIGHRPDAGVLAWLTELPIVRGAAAVSMSPVANAVGAAAIAGSALLGVGDDVGSRRSAFAAEMDSLTSLAIPDDDPTTERSRDGVGATPTVPATAADDTTATATATDGGEPPLDPAVGDPVADDGPTEANTTTTTTPTTPTTTHGTTPDPDGAVSPGPTITTPPTVPSPTLPSPTLPSPTLPPPTLPPTTLPPTTLPPTTVPSVVVPSVSVPSVTVPPIAVPPITVPSVGLPSVSVPSVVVLPGVTTPAITTPAITTPAITTPTVTTPVITTPAITIPAITTPTVPPPLDDLLGDVLGGL